jgi:surface polysaccharide O-acyltransferase-like enzyme
MSNQFRFPTAGYLLVSELSSFSSHGIRVICKGFISCLLIQWRATFGAASFLSYQVSHLHG